jgi:hypothetical protein
MVGNFAWWVWVSSCTIILSVKTKRSIGLYTSHPSAGIATLPILVKIDDGISERSRLRKPRAFFRYQGQIWISEYLSSTVSVIIIVDVPMMSKQLA